MQHNESLKPLQKIEETFDRTLGTWKTYPAGFEVKEDINPISSIPYTVLKVHKEMYKIKPNFWFY